MSRKIASLFAVGALFDGLEGGLGSSYKRPNDEYHSLDPLKIIQSETELSAKISRRFPGRGIDRLSGELTIACRQSAIISHQLSKPNWWLRSIQYLLILMILFSLGVGLSRLSLSTGIDDMFELIQGVESSINDLVFLVVAVWFIMKMESAWKRRISLRSLHKIRSIAHVIDMHQLAKDPEVLDVEQDRDLAFLLIKYLDYCSDMLSIASKAAALHVQGFEDQDTLSAVREIEALTDGFRTRIWQKIGIIERRNKH
jgi:hypothetical protein